MQYSTIILLLLLYLTDMYGQSANSDKILFVKKSPDKIIIDGIIDSLWTKADSSSDFFQMEPFFNQKPSVETTVKLLSDDSYLYALFICYDDNPNQILANQGMHDGFTGDIVSIMIDTFGDKQSAYKFAVNASGVKSDSRLLDDGRQRDYTWDGIWDAESRIYHWGYVVEIRIPFKSIKFTKGLNQWGLDFDRFRSFNREDLFWCKYEQNEGQRISKFGKIIFVDNFPSQTGLNLEIYPVGISKMFLQNDKYKNELSAGLDITYNPSEQLTLLFSAYPDFAQIEADPFNFNISRYETYFRERRPFFTQGNEIFLPAGRERSSGFYNPLELFYSRRVGRILPESKQVPIIFGSKVFGKIDDYDYGAFISMTDRSEFTINNELFEEPSAVFGAVRLKRKILENSSIGVLFVSKITNKGSNSVLDLDGAFRESDWQLAYQLALALKNSKTDYAFSTGFRKFSKSWGTLFKLRGIGKNFDVSEIGFVPWRGTFSSTLLTGPLFIFDSGSISNIFSYAGTAVTYEDEDLFYDKGFILGLNVDMRHGWGFEVNLISGKSKDNSVSYRSFNLNISSWLNFSQNWSANFWMSYSNTYNFRRKFIAPYSSAGTYLSFRPISFLNAGSSFEMFFEGNPDNKIEEITVTVRPFFSLTPVNHLNFRIYVDNVYTHSSEKLERLIIGFLFSWNFSAKSWIYLAINEVQDRFEEYDSSRRLISRNLRVVDRVGVLKINYLYYF